MTTEEKKISYTTTNTYVTLHELNDETKNLWWVFHGMGYLSKYFIKYFSKLPKNQYIICPQAPAKYYQGKDFKYVGASWLTKENTSLEMNNLLNYLNAIEKTIPTDSFLTKVFGYSQGVSVAMRWMASTKKNIDHLIIHSGSIPVELKASDFDAYPELRVDLIYGKNDEYITSEKLNYQIKKAKELFGNRVHFHPFEGKHEVNIELIQKMADVSKI